MPFFVWWGKDDYEIGSGKRSIMITGPQSCSQHNFGRMYMEMESLEIDILYCCLNVL